jgi:hypothetical protein
MPHHASPYETAFERAKQIALIALEFSNEILRVVEHIWNALSDH